MFGSNAQNQAETSNSEPAISNTEMPLETPHVGAVAHAEGETSEPDKPKEPEIDYKATQQVLEKEADRIRQQIEEQKNLEAQVTQQYLLGLIEIEQENIESTKTVARAQAEMEAAEYRAQTDQINAQATQQADAAIAEIMRQNELANAELQAEIERNEKQQEQWERIDKALLGALQIIIGIMLIIAIALIFVVTSWTYREIVKRHKMRIAGLVRQTIAIETQVISKDDMQARIAKMLSRSIAYWNTQKDEYGDPINGREQTQIPSYDKINSSGTDWMELTDYLVRLHIAEKQTGRGGGTFFKYGNLHEWMLASLNGRLERPNPLEVGKVSSPPPVIDA